ncbi:MAG: malto-oligosyltrehalose synthase [Planctomycetes bacterium RBG_16_55_9]|nr:MAG: malto-oligosyltrehalose synthase [Planctomycetes bacterium RBG_16_55_9]
MYVPTATYRLQFGPSFGFKDAETLVPYLHALGVSDIYASPIFKANKGSTHGYDVTNPNELNPQLGSAEDFSALTAERRAYNMGWIQDIVPNHMAYSGENHMLMDVFENGRDSPFADFFDVAWDHPDESLRGKILAPFLGKSYSQALCDGEIRLERSESGLAVRYGDIRFPLALSSYGRVQSTADMPALDCLLEKQLFKLCFWKRANESINYRRFFYLNNFIALKADRPEVFDQTHKLISEFIHQGVFNGLRTDHIDGLYDPSQYLARLRRLAGDKYIVVEKILDFDESLPAHWPVQGTTGYDFCNYVNGIFIRRENEQTFTETYRQFVNRPVHYDELLREKKRAICEKYMAGDIDYLVHLLRTAAQACPAPRFRGGDIIPAKAGIAERDHPRVCSELPEKLRQAVVEIIAAFGVYRTYINEESYRSEDRTRMKEAIDGAKRRNPALKEAIDLVGQFLLLDVTDVNEQKKILRFVMKFQQVTGPVMAKGFEDTLLYNYNRLVGLNEVGASPSRFGISLDEFHKFNAAKAAHWPHGLNATNTHDTKRGEDVRARISVLTEMPQLWSDKVRRWRQINAGFKSDCRGILAPDSNDEYLLYQTLIGAMPLDPDPYSGFEERIKQYIIKAVREAKEHSSWVEPNEPYERACCTFVDRILDRSVSNEFWSDFLPFQKQIAAYGIFNSLSQTLLKMTSPGVPDFYQGSELWDFNLVDPDNRRPVDFERRRRFLDTIRSKEHDTNLEFIDELLRTREDGRIKLFLIFKVLNARRRIADLFEKGDYQPLQARGKYRGHVVGFFRSYGDQRAVTIAPRFLASLIGSGELPLGTNVWQDTEIRWPASLEGRWHNAITGESLPIEKTIRVGDILTLFPVSLLIVCSDAVA